MHTRKTSLMTSQLRETSEPHFHFFDLFFLYWLSFWNYFLYQNYFIISSFRQIFLMVNQPLYVHSELFTPILEHGFAVKMFMLTIILSSALKVLFSCLRILLLIWGKSTVIFKICLSLLRVIHPFFLAALSTFSLYLFSNFITICLAWICFSFSYLEYLGLPGSVDSCIVSQLWYIQRHDITNNTSPYCLFYLFWETEACMINLFI